MAGKNFDNEQLLKGIKSATQTTTVKQTNKESEKISIMDMAPAPTEMNPYPLLKEDNPSKYAELKMSIAAKGVLNPLYLWEQADGKYMILSGHNRREACSDILSEYADDPNFDKEREKFLYPPVRVFKKDELDEESARELIYDTNVQREKISPKERTKAVKSCVEIYSQRKDLKGRTLTDVIRDMGVQKSTIYNYMSIHDHMIPQLQELFYNGTLKVAGATKVASLNIEVQKHIADEWLDELTDKKAMQLKKKMDFKAVDEVLGSGNEPMTMVAIPVPRGLGKQFRKVGLAWASNEEFREKVENLLEKIS